MKSVEMFLSEINLRTAPKQEQKLTPAISEILKQIHISPRHLNLTS